MKGIKILPFKKVLFAALLCFFLMVFDHVVFDHVVIVHAEELQMLYTTEEVNLYEKENTASKILDTIQEGIPIMVLEQGENFCKVQYKDNTGYVATSKLQIENVEVAKEVKEQQDYNNAFMNEIFRIEDERKKSKIWGGVIVGLVVLIFGVGIFHTIRTKHASKESKN